ncbi:hypothetical protein [Anabaena sp. 90]|uniref:hypothetical protein n=1 Tax=Anabaena sp. 90 TaxID=46234 RepID=UPI001F309204|nr:hypothetical protein [Anabaena sp. 90]
MAQIAMTFQKLHEQVLMLPEDDRWELINILMKSLRSKPALTVKHKGIASSLVGIAKTDAPAPTDEEVTSILETRLLQK